MAPSTVRGTDLRPGQKVLVRDIPVTGHVRTPWYVKGRVGTIVADRGRWPNPELLAYGRPDPDGVDLYAVEFEQTDLWAPYPGSSRDRLMLDLYAHWLEPADGDPRG